MNKNVESHFAQMPDVEVRRSMFDRSCGHQTTFNVGDLVPLYWDWCLPGDSVKITTSTVLRLQTLLTPIFSNVYVDVHWFNVPIRLIYNKTKEFFGENTEGPWYPETSHQLPICSFPSGGFDVGTIADYLGVPTGVSSIDKEDWPCALPFRAYAAICEQWYRDQNVSDPLNIPLGEADQTGSNGSNYITDVVNGGKPFKAAKFHDLFSSALPSPQKGPAASIYFSLNEKAPVYTGDIHGVPSPGEMAPLKFRRTSDDAGGGSTYYATSSPFSLQLNSQNASEAYPSNLWADVSFMQDITVNDLRLSFQLQKFYEAAARSGTRYREYILGMYGVRSPDTRMQIPEYLGGHRFPLQIHQVANTSQSENDFLGDLGAMSSTANVHDDVMFSSTEFSIIMCVAVARYDHSYPQGLEKKWSYRNKFDFALPIFAHLGEVGIKKREICFANFDANTQPEDDTNGQIFGFNENYYEYRFNQNRVSGEMRPGIPNTLSSWHLSDYYTQVPSLSDSWIREDKTNVDRVLAVTSAVSNQIFGDFYFKMTWTRPLPVYSVPGLIDHF